MRQKNSLSQFLGGLIGGVLGMLLFVWTRNWLWPIPVGGLVGFSLGYYRREILTSLVNLPSQVRAFRRRTKKPALLYSQARWERAKSVVAFLDGLGVIIGFLPVYLAIGAIDDLELILLAISAAPLLLCVFTFLSIIASVFTFLSMVSDDHAQETYWVRNVRRLNDNGFWGLLGFVILATILGLARTVICTVSIVLISVWLILDALLTAVAVISLLLLRGLVFMVGPNGHWLGAVTTVVVTYGFAWQWQALLTNQPIQWKLLSVATVNGLVCGVTSVAVYQVFVWLAASRQLFLPSVSCVGNPGARWANLMVGVVDKTVPLALHL